MCAEGFNKVQAEDCAVTLKCVSHAQRGSLRFGVLDRGMTAPLTRDSLRSGHAVRRDEHHGTCREFMFMFSRTRRLHGRSATAGEFGGVHLHWPFPTVRP